MPRRWSLAFTLALLAASGPLHADEGPSEADKKQALELYDQGARAFSQKRYHDAVGLFLSADKLIQNPAFAYNIALSYEAVGERSRALRWAREFLRRAPDSPKAEEIGALATKLQLQLAERGLQQMTVRSVPSGATVSVDGRPRGVTPWTGDLVPGEHTISVTLRGYDDLEQVVQLPAEEAIDVDLALKRAAPTPSALPPPEPPPPPPETEVSVGPWTYAILGAGLAGVGAGVGLHFAWTSAEDDARAAQTQLDALDAIERRDDLQLGSSIAFGVGGGLMAVGAGLLVVDLLGLTAEQPSPVETGAFCSPDYCGGSLRYAF